MSELTQAAESVVANEDAQTLHALITGRMTQAQFHQLNKKRFGGRFGELMDKFLAGKLLKLQTIKFEDWLDPSAFRPTMWKGDWSWVKEDEKLAQEFIGLADLCGEPLSEAILHWLNRFLFHRRANDLAELRKAKGGPIVDAAKSLWNQNWDSFGEQFRWR